MNIPELTDDVRAQIKHDQAHRFPELRFIFKPGDDGKELKLPVVLGIPSGAAKMPDGLRISKAWGKVVAATFGHGEGTRKEIVTDCVLWPPPATWAKWAQRWPALEISAWPMVVAKYGGDTDLVTEPGDDVEKPAAIAEALTANSGATWIRFSPIGAVVDIVIKAPSSMQWAMFTEAMKPADAKHWDLAADLATACTVASTMPIAEAFARWPGLVLQVDRHAGHLAGASTKYEEGEL